MSPTQTDERLSLASVHFGEQLAEPRKVLRDVRCPCGSLLLRLVDAGTARIEIKCRRCRRVHTVSLRDAP